MLRRATRNRDGHRAPVDVPLQRKRFLGSASLEGCLREPHELDRGAERERHGLEAVGALTVQGVARQDVAASIQGLPLLGVLVVHVGVPKPLETEREVSALEIELGANLAHIQQHLLVARQQVARTNSHAARHAERLLGARVADDDEVSGLGPLIRQADARSVRVGRVRLGELAASLGIAGVARARVVVLAHDRVARHANARRAHVAVRARVAVVARPGHRLIDAALDLVARIRGADVAVIAVLGAADRAGARLAGFPARADVAVFARQRVVRELAALLCVAAVARAQVAVVARLLRPAGAHAVLANVVLRAHVAVFARTVHGGVRAPRNLVA